MSCIGSVASKPGTYHRRYAGRTCRSGIQTHGSTLGQLAIGHTSVPSPVSVGEGVAQRPRRLYRLAEVVVGGGHLKGAELVVVRRGLRRSEGGDDPIA